MVLKSKFWLRLFSMIFAALLVSLLQLHAAMGTPMESIPPVLNITHDLHVHPPEPNTMFPKRVLAIGAANGFTDWKAVQSFSPPCTPPGHEMQQEADGQNADETRSLEDPGAAREEKEPCWTVRHLELDGFGDTMRQQSFQAALGEAQTTLVRVLHEWQPNALVLASKGVNVGTFLAVKRLFSGPIVLLSPIPNACNHIIVGNDRDDGDVWDDEWKSTLDVLHSHSVEPVVVGVGSSIDEQLLIVDMIREQAREKCGELLRAKDSSGLVFEKCRRWYLHPAFPGNHKWKGDAQNYHGIASLIDKVFALEEACVSNEIMS